jgi:membrane protease YdiL (CAAX protease family)
MSERARRTLFGFRGTTTLKSIRADRNIGPWEGLGVFLLTYALSFLLFSTWNSLAHAQALNRDQYIVGGISWKVAMLLMGGMVCVVRPRVMSTSSFSVSFSGASLALLVGVIAANIAAEIQLRLGQLSFPGSDPLVLFFVVIASPIIEELFFRGIVLNSLLQRWPAAVSIAICATLFASTHESFWPSFVSEVILCGTYLCFRRSVAITTIAHFSLNLAASFPSLLLLSSVHLNRGG